MSKSSSDSRFKPGDRVVVVSHKGPQRYGARCEYVYTPTGTVGSYVGPDEDNPEDVLVEFEDKVWDVYPEDLELEDVYNSPLYQALK